MVKLGGFGARRPAQLSGGQQQRVALARALVFEPELILLDEPLGALDKQLRERMQYELISLHERLGVTMVYVTHDQSEALTMSDRIAVFNDGRIQQLAGPTDLYERPANAFVAGFVGENNRLTGSVTESRNGRVVVRLPDGKVMCGHARGCTASRRSRAHQHPAGTPPSRRCATADNAFACTVERLVYLGDTVRLIVRLGAEELVLKIDSRATAGAMDRGAPVTVGLERSRLPGLRCRRAMSRPVLLSGGRVLDLAARAAPPCDVLVIDGMIAAMAPPGDVSGRPTRRSSMSPIGC